MPTSDRRTVFLSTSAFFTETKIDPLERISLSRQTYDCESGHFTFGGNAPITLPPAPRHPVPIAPRWPLPSSTTLPKNCTNQQVMMPW